jgi:2-polyprenyl-3-methyl-5-hydroxy-6-metoxy-1,4-benzoquinol methylase
MATLFQTLRSFYRAVLPVSIRSSTVVGGVKKLAIRALGDQAIYNDEYFAKTIEPSAASAAPVIVRTAMRDFAPSAVLDVGCGTGAMLAGFRSAGCRVRGLEYADAAIEFCRNRGLDVTKFDLEKDEAAPSTGPYDLVISMEVAEHLPESVADRYVALLASMVAPGGALVFTAAHPGQGGTDHVNEQPAEYWQAKISARGLVFDPARTTAWREEWKQSSQVESFYFENLMVFHRPPLD